MTNLPKEVEERFDERWYAGSDYSSDHEKWFVRAISGDEPGTEIKAFLAQELQRQREEIGTFVLPRITKFIDKVDSGRARSKETYADMKEIVSFLTPTPDTDVQGGCCEKCYYAGDMHPNAHGIADPNTSGCSNEACPCHTVPPTKS